MRRMPRARLLAPFLLSLASCHGTAVPPPESTAPAADRALPTFEGPVRPSVTLATFNIQVLGQSKLGKPAVVATLVDVVNDYDLVAVQEIRDATETTAGAFRDALNAGPEPYAVIVGPRLGRTSSKEQYAFFYRERAVEPLPGAYTYADPGDRFEREPYIVPFRVRGGGPGFDFVCVNVHTKPEDATAEIAALVDVVADVQQRFPDEGDIIVLGDFNADGAYYDEDGAAQPLRAPAFRWLIPNDTDTTVAASANTYDRVVWVAAETDPNYAGTWGVRRFDEEPAFLARGAAAATVSDHYPVWVRFWAGEGLAER
jgi:endonuclease/exonuclease/phosphatase family metal-dependent hydrolase